MLTTGFSVFAECQAHSAKAVIHSAKALPSVPLGKDPDDKGGFAECRSSGTRQRGCREPRDSAKLPRGTTVDGDFADCLTAGTRQSSKLCRVSGLWHSAKPEALGKLAFSGSGY